jgi:hypothetical protein
MVVAFVGVGCSKPKIPTARVSGTITVNGKPIEGIEVLFVPERKIRPGFGATDSSGRYEAKFLERQLGVPLGPCVIQLSRYGQDHLTNQLPEPYNVKSSENPDLRLDIKTTDPIVFNYDVKMDGPLP